MSIKLEPGAQQLLRAVAAGTVKRHRASMTGRVRDGDDFEDDPNAMPAGLRKAKQRLLRLRRAALVELPDGDPMSGTWPWVLTPYGEQVLAEIPKSRHAPAMVGRLSEVIAGVLTQSTPGAVSAEIAEAVLDAGYRPIPG